MTTTPTQYRRMVKAIGYRVVLTHKYRNTLNVQHHDAQGLTYVEIATDAGYANKRANKIRLPELQKLRRSRDVVAPDGRIWEL